jgi:hypothetical protein
MADPDDQGTENPDKRILGLPYDFRRPTTERVRSRAWNPEDTRLFTPKTFGWGYGLNVYWLVHPLRYARRRRS